MSCSGPAPVIRHPQQTSSAARATLHVLRQRPVRGGGGCTGKVTGALKVVGHRQPLSNSMNVQRFLDSKVPLGRFFAQMHESVVC